LTEAWRCQATSDLRLVGRKPVSLRGGETLAPPTRPMSERPDGVNRASTGDVIPEPHPPEPSPKPVPLPPPVPMPEPKPEPPPTIPPLVEEPFPREPI